MVADSVSQNAPVVLIQPHRQNGAVRCCELSLRLNLVEFVWVGEEAANSN